MHMDPVFSPPERTACFVNLSKCEDSGTDTGWERVLERGLHAATARGEPAFAFLDRFLSSYRPRLG
jgi:hypothetical protein